MKNGALRDLLLKAKVLQNRINSSSMALWMLVCMLFNYIDPA